VTAADSAYDFSHAVETLEFGAVLELIARRSANESARGSLRALAPTTDEAAIGESLAEIEEYRLYRAENGDVVVGDTSCREDLERASESGFAMGPDRMLAVAAAERAAADMARALAEADSFPRLAAIADGIRAHVEVADAIERAIDTDGSIKDTASPALRSIRKDIHGLRGSLRSLSEKLVSDYGADSLGTMLGARYVVLVPRAKIRKSTGMVHSASHSGGSLYFEPFSLVERNNDLEARVADERAEEARILDELRRRIAECADEVLQNLDVVDRVDRIRACGRFADELDCTTPSVSTGGRIHLIDARHPVLQRLLVQAGGTQVPLRLTLEPERRLMVITGPNAGGKTVALKTVGVCALLFQCGLPVPCAAGSELPIFARVFADIGDEQSMESSLSTFTSHLRHLDAMSRLAAADSLCLIDEIGDGTDPDEGAALAVATLERLRERGAAVIATTHYGRIKTFALQSDGVANASMAFEDTEGRPLYRLLQGVAGRSRGLETAQRTGFDAGVIERARAYVGAEAFRLESVLAELERNLRDLEDRREALARREAELDRLVAEYEERAAQYDMTRKEAMRRASREAESLLVETRREVERLVRSIRESQADRGVIRKSREKIAELGRRAKAARERSEPPRPALGTVRPGDRVSLSPSGSPAGVVTAVENDSATVEIDGKRIKIRIGALYEAVPERAQRRAGVDYDYRVEPLTSTSIDVRGQEREEAMAAVTRFIDQAVYTGVREVTVIHGIGTGVLSRSIGELLRGDYRVESTRPGEQVEGGMGVTVVILSGDTG
jgi:DNA mismatch repair protein MutS2